MRSPGPDVRLWWSSGGDILRSCPRYGARVVEAADAQRLAALHAAALAGGPPPHARAFHRAHAAQLVAALAASAAWRRASQPCR